MKEKKEDKKSTVVEKHFFCHRCKLYWKTNDFKTEDENFYSKCPECGDEIHDVPHYYANLGKMWNSATGPRTEKGKKRTSLNAYKTGLTSKNLTLLAPANYDKYTHCEDCEQKAECEKKTLKYCPVNLDPMLKFLHAYESGDTEALKHFAGLAQAKTHQVLLNIYASLFEEGVMVESKHRDFTEKKRNPLLDILPKIMEVCGFTSDQYQTNPAAVKEENDLIGTMKLQGNPQDFIDFMHLSITSAAKAADLAAKNRSKDSEDPELETGEKKIEHQGPNNNPFPEK